MDPQEKYVGISHFLKNKKKFVFDNLIDNMVRRLPKWRGKTQSQAGWTIMVKNVLNTIHLYHMSKFKLPEETIKKIDSIQIRFWWNKPEKKSPFLTSFSGICKSYGDGGLNFREQRCSILLGDYIV